MKNSENYPLNLLDKIAGGIWEYELPADFDGSLEYVLAGLTDRERSFIYARFRDKNTLDGIAANEHISKERVRQIIEKAVRKLAHPSRRHYLIYGVKGMEIKALQEALSSRLEAAVKCIEKIAENFNDSDEICKTAETEIQLDDIDLSVRCRMCLKRAGIETLGDICALTQDELAGIRNLGKKAFNEIIDVIHNHGLELSRKN